MKRLITLSLGLLLGAGLGMLRAQTTVTKQVLIANGGQFDPNPGYPANPANVQIYDPSDGSYTPLDTIGTTSVQDLLIEGSEAFLAAGDSVMRYDLATGTRLAAEAFGGESTITLGLTDSLLLVGNFFLPFGSTDPYPNNLRIFDRETLTLVDSVPALSRPVKSIAVDGDFAYVTQNFTSASFSDSAGFMVKLNLSTLAVEDTIEVNQNDEDLGPLLRVDSLLFGLNGASNTITTFNLNTQTATTDTANADLMPGSYGSRYSFDANGDFYLVVDGDIAQYDLATRSLVQGGIVDTVISGFALDTLNDRFYVTQTDFFSYTGGIIYDQQGTRLDTLLAGFAPEVIEVVYNTLPQASDLDVALTADDSVFLADLGVDPDPGARLTLEIVDGPSQGTATVQGDSILYRPAAGFVGSDSLSYAVTDEWGDTDTAVVSITVEVGTSVRLAAGQDFSLAPNPGHGYLSLRFEQPWSGEVQLLDLSGRVLRQQEVQQGTALRLDGLSALPSGVYVLRGVGTSGNWQQRWIKQ